MKQEQIQYANKTKKLKEVNEKLNTYEELLSMSIKLNLKTPYKKETITEENNKFDEDSKINLDRWFLKSLLPVKEEEEENSDEVIRAWIQKYKIEKLIVDFPLSLPKCQTCNLDCPGERHCPQPDVANTVVKIKE